MSGTIQYRERVASEPFPIFKALVRLTCMRCGKEIVAGEHFTDWYDGDQGEWIVTRTMTGCWPTCTSCRPLPTNEASGKNTPPIQQALFAS